MRTFIAIELPDPIQQQVRQVQGQLQTYLRDSKISECISWTPVTKIHLTLRFLGETSKTQHEIVARRLALVTVAQIPFSLSLGALGCFPHFREPNVVWLDVQGELTELLSLQTQIEQVVSEAGFVPEKRPFSPHITIGRARRDSNRAELRRTGEAVKRLRAEVENQQRPFPVTEPFVVNQVVHMQSELRPEGARYTQLKRYSFGTTLSWELS